MSGGPQFRFEPGSIPCIDGCAMAILQKDRRGVTLSLPGEGGEGRLYPHDLLHALYQDRRLTIIRPPQIVATSRHAALFALTQRPLATFREAAREEMVRRLQYVEACDRFFERFPQTPSEEREYPEMYQKAAAQFARRPERGYARIAQMVSRFRRMQKARLLNVKPSALAQEKCGGSTLSGWYRDWKAFQNCDQGCQVLIPMDEAKGPQAPRLDPRVLQIIEAKVATHWLTRQKMPLSKVHRSICAELNAKKSSGAIEAEVTEPCLNTVKRWIHDHFSKAAEDAKREGKLKAEGMHDHGKRAPKVTKPLQMVEIDHTPLDVLLVDEDWDGNPKTKRARRAYLTTVHDTATRMVVGFYITHEAPSWISVAHALRVAINQKSFPAHPLTKKPWLIFGVPQIVKLDRGAEFRSASMRAAAVALHMELRYCKARNPWGKGKIERFYGEVARDFCAPLPGRTFANIEEKGDYPAEKLACLTLSDVNDLFTLWLVGIYHNSSNDRLLGQTPLQAFESLSLDWDGPRLPPSADDLIVHLGIADERRIGPEGIRIHRLAFLTPELKLLGADRRARGRKFQVRTNPDSLEDIFVLDPFNRKWIRVACATPDDVRGRGLVQYNKYRRTIVSPKDKAEARSDMLAAVTAQENLLDKYKNRDRGANSSTSNTPADLFSDNGQTARSVSSPAARPFDAVAPNCAVRIRGPRAMPFGS